MHQMKKWIWLLLALLVAFAAVSGSGFLRQRQESPLIETIRVKNQQPGKEDAGSMFNNFSASSQPGQSFREDATENGKIINAPQVSADRLFAHIQNLNYKRYTSQERSRTRNYITSELKKLGWKPQLQNFAEGVNIFAERQGTDKKAGKILVGAHYDTVAISPGADDNASGVAALLEIARLLGTRQTPRTLQLVFFDKEEAGLLGSKAFTTQSAQLLQNLRGVIVMDMIGYACYTAGCQQYPASLPVTPPSDKGDFVVVVGDTEHLPLLNTFQKLQANPSIAQNAIAPTLLKKGGEEIPPTPLKKGGEEVTQNPLKKGGEEVTQNSLNKQGEKLSPLFKGGKGGSQLPPILPLPVPLKGLLTPDVLRSDHAPFWLQGVGAVLVTDTANLRSPHYHQPSDTPSTIEQSFFTGAAQVVINATTTLLENSGVLNTPASNS